MSSKLDNIVSRLFKAKKTGSDSWVACCPIHDDKNPSMTVREAENGKILIHCFAGCEINDILASIGLTIQDVMPDSAPDELRRSRKIPFSPADVLACAKSDALTIYLALCDLDKGVVLTQQQITNAKKAAGRIYAGAQLGGA